LLKDKKGTKLIILVSLDGIGGEQI
jgi:hypothetical protein